MSNTKKSAAPARALSATTLLLAAAVALELSGMQALSHTAGGPLAVAGADGATVTAQVERAAVADVVAQAGD